MHYYHLPIEFRLLHFESEKVENKKLKLELLIRT